MWSLCWNPTISCRQEEKERMEGGVGELNTDFT